MKIFKYDITNKDTYMIPYNSRLLKVGVQDNIIYAWIKVPQDDDYIKSIKFKIVATGELLPPVNSGFMYFDTVFVDSYVWHIFIK